MAPYRSYRFGLGHWLSFSNNVRSGHYSVALELTTEKREESATHCTYSFGPPSEMIGTVRMEKASGDVEISDFSETGDGPSLQFYLAQVVPRLQRYHADATYPDRDRWTATG